MLIFACDHKIDVALAGQDGSNALLLFQ